MNEMHAAQMQNKATIMSLPEGLFCNIGSWLDDRDSCKMEVASKAFYNALSRPSGTPRGQLVLGAISREDSPTVAPPRSKFKRPAWSNDCFRKARCMGRAVDSSLLSIFPVTQRRCP